MRPDPGGPRPDSPLPAPQMTADAIANNLDEQLKDVGARLQEAPPDSDDLLKLLADVELNLMVVDQSPAASTFAAVRPAMDALVRNELLTHPNAEVRLAIASCISEVTRITAPEAPYDDNIMRDLFSIIVGTFQNLDDIESPSFSRRLSVLETLAKVRSCVVMLDLELDDLILQMFKHFFATVTSKQPEIIISCMATTMKLVIDESEEIQTALASYLLQKARNEERETSPASFQLAEKVISSCEDGKLKPIFLQLLQVQGTPLDEYSKIVRLVCEGGKVIRKDNIVDLTGKDTVDDGKLSERTISDELPQESSKLEQDGAPTTAISSGATLVDNGEANQGPVSPKGQASPKGPASPKKKPEEPEDTKGADQLKSANDEGVEPVDAMPKKSSDVDSEKDLKLKHCNSVATPRSNVDVDKEAHVISGELSADKKVVNGVADNVPKRADTAPDIVKPKRGRPPGPKSSEKKAARNNQSSDLDLKKTEEAMDSTGKLTKRSAKDDIKSSTKKTGEGESSKKTARNNQSSDLDLKKTEEAMDSTGKLTKRSAKDDVKSSTKRTGEGESPKKQQKPSLKQHKEEVLSEEDTAKDMTLKEMVSPKSLTKGSGRTKGQGGDNNVVKRKREQDTEELPRSRKDKGLDGSLVGARIKVWWPDDEMFYKGVVDSFDNHSKRHKVAYDDGDVEVLLLRDEKWDFISEEESKTPDVPSDIPRGRKGRGITLLPVKEEKIETPKSDGGALPKKRGRPKGWRPNNGTPSKSKGKTAMKDAKGTPKTPSEIKKEVKEKATTGSADKVKDDLGKDSSNEKLKEVGSKGKDVSKSGDGSVKGRPGRKPKSAATTPVVGSGSGSVQEKRKEKEAQKEEKEEAEASEMEQEASGKGASSTGKKRRRKA